MIVYIFTHEDSFSSTTYYEACRYFLDVYTSSKHLFKPGGPIIMKYKIRIM